MDEVGNAFGGEACAAAAPAGGFARPIALLVEKLGDLGIDVIVEELIGKRANLRTFSLLMQ